VVVEPMAKSVSASTASSPSTLDEKLHRSAHAVAVVPGARRDEDLAPGDQTDPAREVLGRRRSVVRRADGAEEGRRHGQPPEQRHVAPLVDAPGGGPIDHPRAEREPARHRREHQRQPEGDRQG
jgi:hypothetical protein